MAVKVKQHKGKWWVFIDHKGKRKAKCVGGKQAAETAAKKIEAKLTLGDFSLLEENKSQSPTLAEYAAQWLRTYAAAHCKPATVFNYERDYRPHVAPILGEKKLTEITRQDLKQLIADKRNSGLSWSSVKNIIIPLREMLNHAVEDGWLVANPATRIGRFNKKPAERRQNINPLTREELRFFLDSVRQYTPRYYPFFPALARAGLRLGVALALQWGDIDWHGRFMEIQRAYCHRSRKIQSPKNGKTRRVDMS
jgi:integrase